jgi:hypothetical protein
VKANAFFIAMLVVIAGVLIALVVTALLHADR